MKYNKNIIAVLFVLAIFSTAFCKQRNLSSPLSRLVGHWVEDTSKTNIYFGPINSSTNEGNVVFAYPDKKILAETTKLNAQKLGVSLGKAEKEKIELNAGLLGGRAFVCKYRLTTYETAGLSIDLEIQLSAILEKIMNPDQPLGWRPIVYIIERDGQTMKTASGAYVRDGQTMKTTYVQRVETYRYVDNKVFPEDLQ